MSTEGLRDEFQFYLDNQDEMVEKYDGKVVIVKDSEILGTFEDEVSAFTEAIKRHERGTFLIQRVSRGSEAYTATFSTPGITPG